MKIKHLLKKEDFDSVLEKGKKFQGENIELCVQTSDKQEDAQIGIIASRKTEPTAVKRNLLKRIIYGYFRDSKEKIKPGTKATVKLYRKLPETTRKEISKKIREDLRNLLEKAGLEK